jgi:AcrR family transcriptional regulator
MPATRISGPRRQRRPAALAARKSPSQERSQATVDAILDATARLLEQHGYARLTTNHVARKAGISIGSLYQYFPNKESLCHALAERHYGRHAQRYLECLSGVAREPVEAQVRALVRVSCDVAREDPALAKNLYGELSRFGGLDPMKRMREVIEQALAERYRSLPARWRPANPEMVAFIVTVACSQIIGDAVLRKPEWLGDDAFVDEVSTLVLGYYQRLGWMQPS